MIQRVSRTERALVSAHQLFCTAAACLEYVLGVFVAAGGTRVAIEAQLERGLLTVMGDGRMSSRAFESVVQSEEMRQLGLVADVCFSCTPIGSVDRLSWGGVADAGEPGAEFSVRLSRLFERLPVRRQDLASPRQRTEVSRLVRFVAMAHPHLDVTFGRRMAPRPDLLQRASLVFDLALAHLELHEHKGYRVITGARVVDPVIVHGGRLVAQAEAVRLVPALKGLCLVYGEIHSAAPGRTLPRSRAPRLEPLAAGHSRVVQARGVPAGGLVFRCGPQPIQRRLGPMEACSLPADAVLLGGLNSEFILLRSSAGLVIVDQHAAHERVRLEQLVASLHPGTATFELAVAVQVQHAAPLEALGFAVGGVTKVPEAFGGVPADRLAAAMREMDDALLGVRIGSQLLDLLKSRACRGAVMFGDALTAQQMGAIVAGLRRCRYPGICAHGRPSMKLLVLAGDT